MTTDRIRSDELRPGDRVFDPVTGRRVTVDRVERDGDICRVWLAYPRNDGFREVPCDRLWRVIP